MKRMLSSIAFIIVLILSLPLNGLSEYGVDIVEKVRLMEQDIPEGYTFGKIPAFARKVLKNNPWMMDSKAIQRLTKMIYPDGNYAMIKSIHVTILADKKTPFGDDIVCYIILYHNSHTAKDEIKKIVRYVDFNSDRAVLIMKMNLVVFFHVDDVKDFHYIKSYAQKIENTLKKL